MGTPPSRNRQTVEQAIATAGPEGITLTQLMALGLPLTRQQVNLIANALTAKGRAHKVGNGRWEPQHLRWFGTAEAAAAWARRAAMPVWTPPATRHRTEPRDRYGKRVAESLERKRHAEHAAADRRRAGHLPGDPIETERTKRQVIPTRPGRFEVTGRIAGGFRDQGIGRYETEPNSCAAAAATR